MRNVRSIIASLLVFACIYGFASTGYSQGTNLGAIRGTVTDPNGAVMPNAAVQVTDVETNLSRDVTADSDGNYEVPALKPGNYKVTVTASGFKTTAKEVVVRGADLVRVDIKTEIGVPSETVTVTGAESGLIERDQPVIAGSLTNRQLLEVPRDSRDIYEFLYLNPDITQGAGGDGTFKFLGAQSYGAAFSLDGQRSNGGIFGEPTNSQPSLETIGELTVLSKNFTAEYSGIANIRIETKRGTKDWHGSLFYNNKNSALAAWSVQDKNAQAAYLPTPDSPVFPDPYFNLNEAGGSIGGPVPFGGKKTFFLFSYERRWDLAPRQFRATNIPSTPLLTGNFTGIRIQSKPRIPTGIVLTPAEINSNTVCTTANTTPANCAAANLRFNTIPQRLLNPVALGVMNYYPKTNPATPFSNANGRLVNFVQNVPGLLTRDLTTFRLDHDFSDNDKFYAVYNYQIRNGNRSPVLNPLPSFGLLAQHQNNHTLSLSHTHIFSNSLVNELRGGFNYQFLFRRANQTEGDFLSNVGFNSDEISTIGSILGPDLLDTGGHTAFTHGGPFLNIANGGRNTTRNLDQKLYTFGDTVNWNTGNHNLRFGADFVLNKAVDSFTANRGNPRGLVVYPAAANNFDGYARFLIGLPPTRVDYLGSTRRGDMNVSNWENGFFVQDNWQIHPKVTLNLGLRYEIITPFTDKDDLMINFDPVNSKNAGFKGRFIVPSEKTFSRLDPRFINYGVVTAEEAGVGRGLVNTDKNNFAPRVGIAWRLSGRDVLRGGYGIYYPTSAAQGMRDALATNGFNQTLRKTGTQGLPGGINPRGITPFSGGTITVGNPNDFTALAANVIPFDLQTPRFEQFNATYERELGFNTAIRVSYVGTRQHGLIGGTDLNMLPPSTTPFGVTNEDGDICTPGDDCIVSDADAARRPFPRLGSYLASYGNIGSGRSHAFQVEANRRFARGFSFNASYTLLDQTSSGLDTGNSTLGGTIYNQFSPDLDFSRDSFVSRHRFVSYGAYDLPYGRGRAWGNEISSWADAVAGGWQITYNMFAKSGTGFTPFWTCNNCDPVFPGNIGSEFTDAIGDFNGTSYRPRVIGDPYSGISGDRVFNGAAFTVPSTGADFLNNADVAKRNFLLGPGTWGVNLGVHKYFRVTENARLEVGADFNNVFNHPLQSPVGDNSIGNLGDFGISLDAQNRPVILPGDVTPNADFGRTNLSYSQEGIDNRRSIRLKLRFTF